jgi:hypothetical protein
MLYGRTREDLVPIFDDDGEEVLGDILLDASSLGDVHGDRFQRLWRRYKHDMSSNTWAGNAETQNSLLCQ